MGYKVTKAKRFIILDRDGVINYDSENYIRSPEEWRPLEGSLEAISALVSVGFEIAVISNQSGISRKLLSEKTLQNIHAKMISEVEKVRGRITAIYHCPHIPEAQCECRKPKLGMIKRLEKEHNVSVTDIPLIGDKPSDIELAVRAGARPILVRTGYGNRSAASIPKSVEIYDNLASAAEILISEYSP
ncbi:MAG: D-glycero-beta-D-manno-heptose-1,7-bisphosphate 7-phosphatase [Rhodospirillaceae bacterium]|nr:D-glycero-beta-D-manno-heptose-1,7-bisphosphate 7-phosphatase [Rhodospirillaceae bacterium]|tara:strand:- start:36 stop:599 length:564 start_codon:yes stop_codon:yes gene_type:complete